MNRPEEVGSSAPAHGRLSKLEVLLMVMVCLVGLVTVVLKNDAQQSRAPSNEQVRSAVVEAAEKARAKWEAAGTRADPE